VLDGDDVYHRDRLSKLIASAERDNADIVADDLVIFGHNPDDLLSWKQIVSSPGRIGVDEPFWVDPIEYPESNSFYTKAKPLGYLKPIIRAELLRNTQYNVSMHLAEDYDLVMRLLVRGAKMRVYPEIMYYYRRHAASLSHRLSRPKLEPVIRASESFFCHDARAMASPKLLPKWAELRSALIKRHVSLLRAIVFEDFVSGVRERNPIKVLSICMKQPWVIGRIYVPLFARVMPILQRLSRWCVSRGLVFSGPESCLRRRRVKLPWSVSLIKAGGKRLHRISFRAR